MMKTTIKAIGSVLMICTLIIVLSAGSQNRYRVSQLRGKWQLETGSPGSYQFLNEYNNVRYTITYLCNGDTLKQIKYWFYLSDSIVSTFDCDKVGPLSRGGYIVIQSGEDLMPPYEFPCDVYKILTLNQDSLVIQYVPKRGEFMIGGGPVTYKRIRN